MSRPSAALFALVFSAILPGWTGSLESAEEAAAEQRSGSGDAASPEEAPADETKTNAPELSGSETGPVSPGIDEAPPLDDPALRSAPIRSDRSLRTQLFRIPAPRGLILDRYGNPLAQTRATEYLAVNLLALQPSGSLADAIAAVQTTLPEALGLEDPLYSLAELATHWEHRPHVPFPLSKPLTPEVANELRPLVDASERLVLKTIYVREYPSGIAHGHIVGYTRPSMPFQHGPVGDPENLWPRSEGVLGLESAFDEPLRGKDGLTSYVYTEFGQLHDVELVAPPVPGDTLVTTLNRPMQELAYRLLEKNKRPGALVAVDSITGDILAMASFPSFDPNLFVGGVEKSAYESLLEDPDNPLFPRAFQAAYPPGSTFKPFVALAAMDRGVISGEYTRLGVPPSVEIDGRSFRNWHTKHEGLLDVRYALLRSSNTWFYQAGILTGGLPILQTARTYGFGMDPGLPISSVSGSLPEPRNVAARQAVANLSIGQGEVLATPLQLCIAMAGLSVGTYAPRPRLVVQTQDPLTNAVKTTNAPGKHAVIHTRASDRNAVRAGMWGVVNHSSGTGRAAAHDRPQVYGKTGTSQWSSGGKRLNLAWFAGYVGSDKPRIACTVLVEGRAGETLSGGRDAAPIAREFVETIYADTETYQVEITVEDPANPMERTSPPALRPDLTRAAPPERERARTIPAGRYHSGAQRVEIPSRTFAGRPPAPELRSDLPARRLRKFRP